MKGLQGTSLHVRLFFVSSRVKLLLAYYGLAQLKTAQFLKHSGKRMPATRKISSILDRIETRI